MPCTVCIGAAAILRQRFGMVNVTGGPNQKRFQLNELSIVFPTVKNVVDR